MILKALNHCVIHNRRIVYSIHLDGHSFQNGYGHLVYSFLRMPSQTLKKKVRLNILADLMLLLVEVALLACFVTNDDRMAVRMRKNFVCMSELILHPRKWIDSKKWRFSRVLVPIGWSVGSPWLERIASPRTTSTTPIAGLTLLWFGHVLPSILFFGFLFLALDGRLFATFVRKFLLAFPR